MATTNTHSTGNHTNKSELEKFALFYESVPLETAPRSKSAVQRKS
ncbi:MAG: hypothetical protein WBB33_00360 [Candidatus Saccharimonadales bacterium]